jgi:hypothetical protein
LKWADALRGVPIYLRNLWIVKLRPKEGFIFWGHLGLGDQICAAKLLEHWNDLGYEVQVPCRKGNLNNLNQMFSYLENVFFHAISDDPEREALEVEELALQLDLKVVNAGREAHTFIKTLYPREGLNVALMICAGFKTTGLATDRFRRHVLLLPQIKPPSIPYIFLNRMTSEGLFEIDIAQNDRLVVEENKERTLFEHAQILDNASELHSIGSAFMCLSMVIGSKSPVKKFYRDDELLSDDPEKNWEQVLSNVS